MNYILHLNAFLEKAEKADWLGPHHYALYMVLFNRWNKLGFCDSFNIVRQDIMKAAGIGSKSTYYSCMKKLREEKILQFTNSKSRFISATVSLFPLGKHGTHYGPPPVPETGPDGTENEPVQGSKKVPLNKSGKKQLSNEGVKHAPSLEDVTNFFSENAYPYNEALKFYYWYQGSNWKSGRNTPIINWEPFAHKWMLNHQPQKTQCHVNPNKDQDYHEPF